ncbi:hypothetical protein NY607_19855 [Lysinibacillus sp. A4]|uniref:hypothetical protein n=1 Tax=Lysinibacillus sp. A4 TaxID=2976269 RepID=UPI002175A1B5|nr:hypothetical protein [Lysinibacillus sp. A4]MCS5503367.1 hypothetical protein [Lysinibacillus sp. A4]
MQQHSQHLTNYNLITDMVLDISIALEKAQLMQNELNDGYFAKWEPIKKKEEIYYVAWDYDRYGVIARIGEDYLYEIKKKIEELEKNIKALRDLQINEPAEQPSKTTTNEIEARCV